MKKRRRREDISLSCRCLEGKISKASMGKSLRLGDSEARKVGLGRAAVTGKSQLVKIKVTCTWNIGGKVDLNRKYSKIVMREFVTLLCTCSNCLIMNIKYTVLHALRTLPYPHSTPVPADWQPVFYPALVHSSRRRRHSRCRRSFNAGYRSRHARLVTLPGISSPCQVLLVHLHPILSTRHIHRWHSFTCVHETICWLWIRLL